jgi:PAS domain S-box-containing protein
MRNLEKISFSLRPVSEQTMLMAQAERIAKTGSWHYDIETATTQWSDESYRIFGYSAQTRISIADILRQQIHPADRQVVKKLWEKVLTGDEPSYHITYRITRANDQELRYVFEKAVYCYDDSGKWIHVAGIFQDVTDNKQEELTHSLTRDVLVILGETANTKESVSKILSLIKKRAGFDAVGIRLQEGDDFPYYASEGFNKQFLKKENSVVKRKKDGGVCRNDDGSISLECTCGLVLSGKTDPANSLFTKGGSSWTNDSFPFLDVPPEEDPREVARNMCIHQGYASVALIPIKAKDKPIGLLQLNDKRKNRFTLKMIEAYELMCINIGEALMRKQAEENIIKSEEKFRLLLNSLDDVVYMLDENLLFTAIYGQWLQKQNLADKDFLGKSIEDVFGIEISLEHNKANKKALSGESISFNWEWEHNNRVEYYQSIVSPIFDAKKRITGVAGIARNITETKRAEALGKELAVARKSAELKKNFVANMSHEIRTPLTGILGMIEIIQKTRLTAEQSDYINTIKDSGEILRNIINQILDFSIIESGKIELNKAVFSLDELLGKSTTICRSICMQKKDVTFKLQVDPSIPKKVNGDQTRIIQVLTNLLFNAGKFTNRGHITLKVEMQKIPEKQKEFYIKFTITDTGRGIPINLQKHLFTPFSQIEKSDARNFDGTGLGLSICKALTKLHGGSMGMESQYGKGSSFWFTVLVSEGDEKMAKKQLFEQEKGVKDLHILYAEDKVINQKVVKLLLTSLGHKVTLVNNGLEALETYAPDAFDLILMDIQMPVMDGITATQKIREKFGNTPLIIGLSANAFEGDREKYLAQGMDDYLTKPVKRDELKELFSKWY